MSSPAPKLALLAALSLTACTSLAQFNRWYAFETSQGGHKKTVLAPDASLIALTESTQGGVGSIVYRRTKEGLPQGTASLYTGSGTNPPQDMVVDSASRTYVCFKSAATEQMQVHQINAGLSSFGWNWTGSSSAIGAKLAIDSSGNLRVAVMREISSKLHLTVYKLDTTGTEIGSHTIALDPTVSFGRPDFYLALDGSGQLFIGATLIDSLQPSNPYAVSIMVNPGVTASVVANPTVVDSVSDRASGIVVDNVYSGRTGLLVNATNSVGNTAPQLAKFTFQNGWIETTPLLAYDPTLPSAEVMTLSNEGSVVIAGSIGNPKLAFVHKLPLDEAVSDPGWQVNPFTQAERFVSAAVVDSNGNVYLSGVDSAPFYADARITKLRGTTGATLWTKNSIANGYSYFNDVVADSTRAYVFGDRGTNAFSSRVPFAMCFQDLTLTLSVNAIPGGVPLTATVTLSDGAPENGLLWQMAYNGDPGATYPAIVALQQGESQTSFQVVSSPVETDTVRSFFLGGPLPLTAQFTVQAPRPFSLTLNPAAVVGGASSEATLVMTGPSPEAGIMVKLTDNSTAVNTPGLIVVGPEVPYELFHVGTSPVTTQAVRTVYASAFGVTKTAAITINPPTIDSITINPTEVVGGGNTIGTVKLNGPAPLGGRVVAITDNSSSVFTPTSVTVPAGATSANFTIATASVNVGAQRAVSATLGTTKTAFFTLVPGANVSTLTLSTNSIKGGQPLNGTITLNRNAPVGGILVQVTDNSGFIITPGPVMLPQGTSAINFPIDTVPVNATATRQIFANYNGLSKIQNLTLTP